VHSRTVLGRPGLKPGLFSKDKKLISDLHTLGPTKTNCGLLHARISAGVDDETKAVKASKIGRSSNVHFPARASYTSDTCAIRTTSSSERACGRREGPMKAFVALNIQGQRAHYLQEAQRSSKTVMDTQFVLPGMRCGISSVWALNFCRWERR